MTLAEFKAWFEGFTEDMDARPTEKQWKRIKARVKEIDGTQITREIWHRDYYPRWTYPPSPTLITYLSTPNNTLGGNNMSVAAGEYTAALNAAGKAEYVESLAA